MDQGHRRDLVFGVASLVIAAIYYLESLNTPVPVTMLDPIGPARPVQWICLLIGAFAMVLLAKAAVAISLRRKPPAAAGEGSDVPGDVPVRNSPGLTVGTFVLIVLYVAVLGTRVLPFAATTTVFVLVAGIVLTRAAWRKLPGLVLLAFIMGFGSEFVFTRFFYIDLP